ncbi:MAG: nicotinate-nucleotide--dimethylbenzimidazole phosphoribosyltransferase [Caulobacteraceae bacterium]|nr:nicotinate-nucleotide--dimethylbenzimidazole phosphoribosyltransferase [Caulobacteraceae bacterium]
MSALPFDDIRALIADAPPMGAPKISPRPALGRLGEIAAWMSCWRAAAGPPRVHRPILALYAGSNGVAAKSAVAGSPDRVRERLEGVAAGGAAVNAMAQGQGAGLEAFDLAIDRPTPDITTTPAMSERECAATMAFGMEALAKQPDLLLLGDISAGGGIAAAAIALALFGGDAAEWTEADEDLVAQAAARCLTSMGRSNDPLEVLRQLGGREIAALAGAILAARTQGVPVILGGYSAAVAAAVLQRIDPRAVEHVLAGDASGSAGYRAVIEEMGLEPLTRLGISDGEGAGAVAALSVVKLACDAA